MLLATSRFEARLIEAGDVDATAVAAARQHAQQDHLPLVDAVVALGLVTERRAYTLLADATGMALVSLDDMETRELARQLVPARLARRHLAVPLSVDNRGPTYATCRPFDLEADGDLSFASGRRAEGVLAPRSDVLAALDRLYPPVRELDRLVGRLRSNGASVQLVDIDTSDVSAGSPVIDFCNQLVTRAVEVGASDIHLEFTSSGASVRYRVCGALEPVIELPADASRAVSDRLKLMARADITVRHRPQDGAFRLRVGRWTCGCRRYRRWTARRSSCE